MNGAEDVVVENAGAVQFPHGHRLRAGVPQQDVHLPVAIVVAGAAELPFGRADVGKVGAAEDAPAMRRSGTVPTEV